MMKASSKTVSPERTWLDRERKNNGGTLQLAPRLYGFRNILATYSCRNQEVPLAASQSV
jgi:hypothetical protein